MSDRAAEQAPTPRAEGFRMPAEWEPHQCCFMAWPTRESLWGEVFAQAKRDYAEVARAIAAFEPVVMICRPGDATDVVDHCGSSVQLTEIEIDDSWTRDSGPVFVMNDGGDVAAVDFGFNSWGGKYLPYANDAALGAALADVLGVRCYRAPFVLEGGAFYTDGQGTLITTEGPVLDPARNASASRAGFERVVGEYLGVDRVVWLVAFPDRDTDGHIDGIAQFAAPGEIVLLVPDAPEHANYGFARENLSRLTGATDARDRRLDVLPFGVTASAEVAGQTVDVPYLNCYLANGGVIAPLAGADEDELALARLRQVFAGREVIGVPGAVLSYGGGGPHCITQQMPLGRGVPAGAVSGRLTRRQASVPGASHPHDPLAAARLIPARPRALALLRVGRAARRSADSSAGYGDGHEQRPKDLGQLRG